MAYVASSLCNFIEFDVEISSIWSSSPWEDARKHENSFAPSTSPEYSLWCPSTPGETADKISLQCFFSETEGKEAFQIPSLLFLTASTGSSHYFLLPEHFVSFLRYHQQSIFIFYDNAKQSTALGELLATHDDTLRDLWWNLVDNSQVRDCMLLDSLIR